MSEEYKIELIKVCDIRVANPRSREAKKYAEIVSSIKTLGLKVPIVVAEREDANGKRYYELVCGEGRLNAYIKEDADEIPARIIQANTEDIMLMSLVENIARKGNNKIALVQEVERLRKNGDTCSEIARKMGYTTTYVSALIGLIESKETEILKAVLTGKMSLATGILITKASDNEGVQSVLNDALQKKDIKPSDVKYISNVICRRANGANTTMKVNSKESGAAFIEACKRDMRAGMKFLQKAEICAKNLAYLKGAFAKLFEDECLMNLLVSKEIGSIPEELLKGTQQ